MITLDAKVGDLVRVVPVTEYPGVGPAVKGWGEYPDPQEVLDLKWIAGPTLAVLLERRDVYWKIMVVPDGVPVWVEHYWLEMVE